jgi:hypothetical protein
MYVSIPDKVSDCFRQLTGEKLPNSLGNCFVFQYPNRVLAGFRVGKPRHFARQ